MTVFSLPPRSDSSEPTVTVKLYALPCGELHLPERWLFADGDPAVSHVSPDYCFLIEHPSGRRVLFDLGLRKDLDGNPEVIQGDYAQLKLDVPEDIYDMLNKGPVQASEIDAVILSHVHFDHVGDVEKFPHAEILVGPGTTEKAFPGWPVDPKSPFLSSIFKHSKLREFSEAEFAYRPCGPFSKAIDFFGDASIFIVDTPGHMPGHQGLLARTGEDEWVMTAGDCCHHADALKGRVLSSDVGPNGQPSFHSDFDTAVQTLERLKQMTECENIWVLLAHDASLKNILPIYPQTVNGWRSKLRLGSDGKPVSS